MIVKPAKDFLVGILVGVMSMMPGASGGIIAVIFGMYERLISDVADIRNRLLKDLRFIIPVGVGILVGLVVCAVGIDALLQNWEVPLMFFFAALILFQLPDLYRLCNSSDGTARPTSRNIVVCVIGFVVMLSFLFIGSSESSVSLVDLDAVNVVLLFVIGVLIALSKIVPGLSGAAILLAIGLYTPLMDLVGGMDMSVIIDRMTALIPLGLGLVVGVLGLSKVVDYFLKSYRRSTYFCIMGITVGSVVTVAVQAIQGLTGDMVLPSVVCIVIGLAFGYCLSLVSAKYAEETISEEPA